MKNPGKAILTAAIACALLGQGALAEVISFTGSVTAKSTREVYAPIDGTVESVQAVAGQQVRAGDVLQSGQSVAELVQPEDVRIEVQLSAADAAWIHVGDVVRYIRDDDPTETPRRATVEGVSAIAGGDGYVARIVPMESGLPLGLSVELRTEE